MIETIQVHHKGTALLDTGADKYSYIGKHYADTVFKLITRISVKRIVNLAGSTNQLPVNEMISLPVTLTSPRGKSYTGYINLDIIDTKIFIIIGLRDICEYFPDLAKDIIDQNHQLLLNSRKKHETHLRFTDLAAHLSAVENLVEGAEYEPWTTPYVSPPEDDIDDIDIFPAAALTDYHARNLEFENDIHKQISPVAQTDHAALLSLLLDPQYRDIFVWKKWKYINITPVKLQWKTGMPQHHGIPPRPVPPVKQLEAEKSYKRFLDSTFWKPASISPRYTTPVVLVWKPDGSIRVCADYPSFINKWLIPLSAPSPDLRMETERLAGYTEFIDSDVKDAFYTIPIDPDDAEKFTVSTHMGNFTPNAIPMGATVGSALLQQLMQNVFAAFRHRAVILQDNVIIGCASHDNRVTLLRDFLETCRINGITLNWKKTKFFTTSTTFWGYEFKTGKYAISDERKQGLSTYPCPFDLKSAQRFCGLANFFAPFVPDIKSVLRPIFPLLGKSYDYKGNQERTEASFKVIIKSLQGAMDLFFPNRQYQWILRTDASDTTVSAVLLQRVPLSDIHSVGTTGQEDADSQLQPLAMVAHQLSDTAIKNWPTHTKELYSILMGLKSCSSLLDGQHILIETDHRNLLYAQANSNALTIRWIRYIQANFIITAILHRPGIRNTVADAMTRSFPVNTTQVLNMLDDFESSDDVLNYLAATYPEHLSKMTDSELATLCILSYAMEMPWTTQQQDTADHLSSSQTKEEALNLVSTLSALTAQEAFNDIHNARAGHMGWAKSYHRLRQFHPSVRVSSRQVQEMVADCATCQKYRPNPHMQQSQEVLHSLPIPSIYGLVTADTFKMPTDTYGMSYVLVILNHVTKMADLQAMPSKQGIEVTKALYAYMCNEGIPDVILTDPGTELANEHVQSLTTWFGIRHSLTIAKRPQGHGTERTVGKTKLHLAILLGAENITEKWSDKSVLPAAKFILNSTLNDEVKAIPLQLKHGTVALATYMRLTDAGQLRSPTNATALVKELDENLQTMLAASSRVQVIQKEHRRNKGAPPHERHMYQPGDYILWRSDSPFRPNAALTSKLVGPFRVMQQTDNIITCTHLSSGRQSLLHHDRCTLLTANESIALSLARQDYPEEEIIVAILQHRGPLEQRQQTQFLVQFSTGLDTWMPYDSVRDTKALEEYGMSKICTRLLLLPSSEEVATWKRAQSKFSCVDLLDSGRIYPISSVVYISSHIFTDNDAFDTAGFTHQHNREYILDAKIIRVTPKHIEISIPLFDMTIALQWYKYQSYVIEKFDSLQEQYMLLSAEELANKKGLCEAINGKGTLPTTTRTQKKDDAWMPNQKVMARLRDDQWHNAIIIKPLDKRNTRVLLDSGAEVDISNKRLQTLK